MILKFSALVAAALVFTQVALGATPRVTQNITGEDILSNTFSWQATYFNADDEVSDPGRIVFSVDGVNKGMDRTRPFSFNLDTTLYSNNDHTFKVEAKRGSNLLATNAVTATIDNDGGGGGGGGGEEPPIAGYTLDFADEFDDPLDPAIWTTKQFWEDEPLLNSVVVSNGTVKINNFRPYIGDQSITTGPYWFGDPVKQSWQFGYFEARMRFTDAQGSWPAFWLISAAHATADWPNCPEPDLNFELDIMEYQGDEPTQFYGTEHRNTGDVCGTSDATRSVFTNPFALAQNWHTYGVEWTASNVTWYVDNVRQGSQPLFDSGDQQMYLALTMQACGWDNTNSCTTSTPSPLTTEVDWVHVWQK
jgi:Glycosyl hydrolases family 16